MLNVFLKKSKDLLDIKTQKPKVFRIQADNLIMCGYFCIGFIDFMFSNKTLTDCTSLYSPYDFKKNDDIILSYLKIRMSLIQLKFSLVIKKNLG